MSAIVIAWILVVVAAFVSGYLGHDWSELLVFKVDDGWCKSTREGLGAHCFGDFGLGYFQGDFYNEFPNDYVPENFITTNTPVTILLFKLLGLTSYNFALALYLGLSATSIVLPLWHATRRFDLLERSVLVTFGGILSYGAIASLDRGNHIALLVTPAYFYFRALAKDRGPWAIACGTAVALLKFWGGLFFIPLLLLRRIRELVVCVALTTFGYLLPLVFFGGSFLGNLRTMIQVNSSDAISSITAPYNISLNGFLQRSICAFRLRTWCNTSDVASQYELKTAVTLLVLVLGVILMITVTRLFKPSPLLSVGIWAISPIVLIPDAAIYTTVFTVVLLAILVSLDVEESGSLRRLFDQHPIVGLSLGVAIVLSTVPVTISISTLSWLGSSNGASNPVFKLHFWMLPLVWLLFLVSACAASCRATLLSQRHKSKLRTGIGEAPKDDSRDETA